MLLIFASSRERSLKNLFTKLVCHTTPFLYNNLPLSCSQCLRFFFLFCMALGNCAYAIGEKYLPYVLMDFPTLVILYVTWTWVSVRLTAARTFSDLKPENLLLDANGILQVSDFGLGAYVYDNRSKLEVVIFLPLIIQLVRATAKLFLTPSFPITSRG